MNDHADTLREVLSEWPAATAPAMHEWVERIKAAHEAEVTALQARVDELSPMVAGRWKARYDAAIAALEGQTRPADSLEANASEDASGRSGEAEPVKSLVSTIRDQFAFNTEAAYAEDALNQLAALAVGHARLIAAVRAAQAERNSIKGPLSSPTMGEIWLALDEIDDAAAPQQPPPVSE